jgi:16S rRNA (adenine1518-N6/adenine1519-N6)-dimethyltransferase
MKLDQHFMTDEKVISDIISKVPKGKKTLEIGPGKGALSFKLAEIASKLILIESDQALGEILQSKIPKAETIIGNALEFNLAEAEIIVSNLPYGISEPFFYQLVRATRTEKIDAAFLTTGIRFFELINDPTTKLGTYAHTFFTVKGFFEIEPISFDPMPDVRSIFFQLTPKYPTDLISVIIAQDDKKLKNACVDALTKTGLTQRQSKEKISPLGEHLLGKRIAHLSNQQFLEVINFLKTL